MDNLDSQNVKYLRAKKRLKKLKSFYFHLFLYLAANAYILLTNVERNALSEWKSYSVALIWLPFLLLHGMKIFMFRNWEERKINDLIKKYQNYG